MQAPRTFRLPTPYFPLDVSRDMTVAGSQTLIASAVWPSANRAIFVPMAIPVSATIVSLSFAATAATDNYDLGLYDASLNKVQSSGSTGLSTGVVTLSLTAPYRVNAGGLIFAALAISGTTGSVFRYSGGAVGQLIAAGICQQATALPLPSTATPGTLTSTYAPVIALGIS